MMKQPQLGKQIASLRKSKGITQEELAKDCNISARTLQRIEAGVVNPRSYTIRVIFEALDYTPGSVPPNNVFQQMIIVVSSFFSRVFNYSSSLLNLKTHKMLKLSALSVMILTAGLGIFTFNTECHAQRIDMKKYVKNHTKDVIWLFPRGSGYGHRSKKDTLHLKVENNLIQETKGKVFLNGEFAGQVNPGDTVIFHKSTLFKKERLEFRPWAYTFVPTKNKAILMLPLSPLRMGNDDAGGAHYWVDNVEILEKKNQFHLNGKLVGEAHAGDTVIYRLGKMTIKKKE